MPPRKEKISKFDKAALEIAEGIANIPVEGKKEAVRLLREVESKRGAPKRSKKLSAKIQTEVKAKSSRQKNTRAKKHE